ncbi:MAG: type II toxin-antitoxin system VapC family toxin [Bryobacteraceae bacterium]
MAILIDTNILLRTMQPHHPHCAAAERAVAALRIREETLHVAAQNLVEFWAVATRPEGENGLGLSIEAATRELATLKRLFSLLPEMPVFGEWERLVAMYGVSGKNTHDARLVASMRAHGITRILTFNVQDFARFREIEALHPDAVGVDFPG